MAWLPDGEKISKISLFVLKECTSMTDTHTHTDRQTPHDGICRACIAYHAADDFSRRYNDGCQLSWIFEICILCHVTSTVMPLGFTMQNFNEIGQSAAEFRQKKTIFNMAAVCHLKFKKFHYWSLCAADVGLSVGAAWIYDPQLVKHSSEWVSEWSCGHVLFIIC